MKKMMSLLLVLCLIVSMVPLAASANEVENTSSGITTKETLQQKIDNSSGETTLRLDENIDLGTMEKPTEDSGLITIPEGKNIVLDLAGYTLSASLVTDGSTYAKAHIILNKGTLTIKDSSNATGMIINTNSSSYACTRALKNTGTLRILGGTVKATSGVGLLNLGNCVISGDNTSIEAAQANYSGGWNNAVAGIENREMGTLTISGGEFSSVSESSLFVDGGSVLITDGTFIGHQNYGALNGAPDSYVTVQGGTFSSDPTACVDQLSYVVHEENGYYTVSSVTAQTITVNSADELKAALDGEQASIISIGSSFTLSESLNIPVYMKVIVPHGITFTISENAILSVDGRLENNGVLSVGENAFLSKLGNVTGSGQVDLPSIQNGLYTVSTAMDLQWLTTLLAEENQSGITQIVLAKDITIPSGVVFESLGKATNITFDGQSYSITGLTIESIGGDIGLFVSLEDSIVKDVTLKDCVYTTQTGYIGGVAGWVSNTTLENVTVIGSISAGASYGVAGITGSVDQGSSDDTTLFINCDNQAAVGGSSAYNVGSMFGTASGSFGTVGIYNSSNSGNITAKGSMGYVFGWGYLDKTAKLEIIGFNNDGKVNGETGSVSSAPGSEFTYNIEYVDGSKWKAVQRADGTWKPFPKDATVVAEVNGDPYAELQEGINAADIGDTVLLLQDTTETITVDAEKDITLDLNGKTVTLNSTMTVDGNLIIQDSTVTAEPVVSTDYDTVTYKAGKILYTGSGTAIVPQNGGKVILKSGIVDASSHGSGIYATGNCDPENSNNTAEILSTITIEGGYVYTREYGIGVQGRGATANIKGGVIATVDNAAIAGNGTSNDQRYLGGTSINVSGGTMIGRITTSGYIAVGIYHPQNGALNIFGGTIYADNGVGICIRNGSLDISGDAKIIATGNEAGKVGDAANQIPGKSVVVDYSSGYNHGNTSVDSRKITIEGGYFSAEQENIDVYETDGNKVVDDFISGGYFTSDPSQYLVDNKIAVESDKPEYNYMVDNVGSTPAEVVPAAPDANVAAGLTGEAQAVAEKIQNKLTANVVTGDGVIAAANSMANKNTVTATEEVLEELNKAISGSDEATVKNTIIVVQPYMEITIEEVDVQDQTVTLDITPMYRTVATTANLNIDEPIVLPGTDDEDAVNAVQIGKEMPLTITKPVTMTLTLPDSFKDQKVYIQHKWYEYSATADDQGKITFTNPHGFSAFTFTTTSQAAAKINDTAYTSLQDAVNHVENGQTIVLLKDGQSATVSREVSFTISNEGGTGFCAELTPGSGYVMTKGENGLYTFTKEPTTPVTPGDGDEDEFPFTDVPSNAWYYNAVKYVFENDLMIGTSDTTFQPKMNLTRAMAAQILYNLEGNPAVTDEATFTDMNTVPNWAKNAIAWAQETGVVAGMGNGTFMPNKNVTREQFAQMMYNYAGFKGYDLTAVGDLTQFADADSISNWAVTALTWANGEGLINGHKDSGQIDPAGTTTRGQAATILMNYDLNLKS